MAAITVPPGALFVITLLVLAAIVLWVSARRRRLFRIHIEAGEVRDVQGAAPDQFVKEVGRLCQFWQIDQGWVQGMRRGQRVAISVGGGIERQQAQIFRNAWNYPIR
jgi:hypothetical protein